MKKENRYKNLVPYVNSGNPAWKLIRCILFDLVKKREINICSKCKESIDNVDEMTLAHIKPWRKTDKREGNKELFWDLENIAIEHPWCNLPDDITNQNGYRGIHKNVYKNTGNHLYQVTIAINNKTIILGYSKDPVKAAEIYDLGVMKYRNGKGVLNFPEKREEYLQLLSEYQKEEKND